MTRDHHEKRRPDRSEPGLQTSVDKMTCQFFGGATGLPKNCRKVLPNLNCCIYGATFSTVNGLGCATNLLSIFFDEVLSTASISIKLLVTGGAEKTTLIKPTTIRSTKIGVRTIKRCAPLALNVRRSISSMVSTSGPATSKS